MPDRSNTCFGRTGSPLNEYRYRGDAEKHARFLRTEHGTEFVPYQCGRCGLWHLSPAERQTPSRPCSFCRDHNGHAKDLYASENAAKKRAEIIFRERGIRLKVYRCPSQTGWHLSSGQFK
jgi:hypothetical protein